MRNKLLVTSLLFFLFLFSSQKTIAISYTYLLAFNDRNVKIIAELGTDKDMDNLYDNDDDSNQDESNAETINNQLNKKQISRLIDYANCNYINISLKSVGLNPCNCDNRNLNFVKLKLSIPDSLKNTLDLANEIEQTKTNFEAGKFSHKTIVEFLTNKIFEDSKLYKNTYNFYLRNNDKIEFSNAVNNINSFVFANENNSNAQTANNNTSKKIKRPMLIYGLLFFNTLISLSALALTIIKYFSSDEKKDANYFKESANSNPIDLFAVSEMIDKKIENSNLKKELNKLREEIKSIKVSALPPPKNGGNTALAEIDSVEKKDKETIQNAPQHETKYANGCEEGGGFKVQNLTDTIQGNSCYVINITAQNAAFEVIDNENAFKVIVAYPNDRLLPVCDVIGDSRGASKIKTLATGILVLEGDTWKLKTKAKVRYE